MSALMPIQLNPCSPAQTPCGGCPSPAADCSTAIIKQWTVYAQGYNPGPGAPTNACGPAGTATWAMFEALALSTFLAGPPGGWAAVPVESNLIQNIACVPPDGDSASLALSITEEANSFEATNPCILAAVQFVDDPTGATCGGGPPQPNWLGTALYVEGPTGPFCIGLNINGVLTTTQYPALAAGVSVIIFPPTDQGPVYTQILNCGECDPVP